MNLLLWLVLISATAFLVCPRGITLTNTSDVINSPLYPRHYPDNQNCSWKITARQGNHVKLVIAKNLAIQGSQAECLWDYLQVQNGFSADWIGNEKICGFPNKIITYYSTLDSLRVVFVSDNKESNWYNGFTASYTQLNYTPPICPTEAIRLHGNGTLSSPNYPVSSYPASRNCSWIVTVPSDKKVKFAFTEFALGSCERQACSSGNCTYVELYDGDSTSSPLLRRFCNGSVKQDEFSSGNQMYVRFRSGSSLDRGFEAQYSVSSGRPTTTTTAPSQTVTAVVVVALVVIFVTILIGIAVGCICYFKVKRNRRIDVAGLNGEHQVPDEAPEIISNPNNGDSNEKAANHNHAENVVEETSF